MKILCAVSQKGGQCKSAIIAHTTYKVLHNNEQRLDQARKAFKAESKLDKTAVFMPPKAVRMVVFDFDPQGSLTGKTFNPKAEGTFDNDVFMYEDLSCVFAGKAHVGQGYQGGRPDHLFIKCDKSKAKRGLSDDEKSAFKAYLKDLETLGFDLVLIDTAGSLSEVTELALETSTHCLIPFQFGGYDVDALKDTVLLIREIQRTINPRLKMLGLMACRVMGNVGSKALAEVQTAIDAGTILPYILKNRQVVNEAVKLRIPVWQGVKTASHRTAAREWHEATNQILGALAK
jgi:cellulose biosynthesis protein BcsQ